MDGPITNRWGDAERVELLPEEHRIYRAPRGAAFNHHPQVVSQNGRLYATWSNGVRHEDDVGQRMVLSVSEDGGETWSDPETVADCQHESGGYAVVTSEGVRAHDDLLVAYYGVYEYTEAGLAKRHRGESFASLADPPDEWWRESQRTEMRISKDGGRSWSAPTTVVEGFVPNFRPFPTDSGRLIMPGNLTFPFTDDPAGMADWTVSGIPGLPEGYVDSPEGFWKGCRHRGDDAAYCEGSFYQTDDGTIHMLLRVEGDPDTLAVTESDDDGETWSEPRLTEYTDCQARFQFGRLPDGRYFGLNCPDPDSNRTPLVLAVSDDGRVFDTHYVLGDDPATGPRIDGAHKGGRYGYPNCHVADGTLYVIHSVSKEDVALVRVPLSDLD